MQCNPLVNIALNLSEYAGSFPSLPHPFPSIFTLFSTIIDIFLVRNTKVLRCLPTHLKTRLADWQHFGSWLFGSVRNNAILLMVIFSLPYLVGSSSPGGAHVWMLLFFFGLIDNITSQIYRVFDPVHVLLGLKTRFSYPFFLCYWLFSCC